MHFHQGTNDPPYNLLPVPKFQGHYVLTKLATFSKT